VRASVEIKDTAEPERRRFVQWCSSLHRSVRTGVCVFHRTTHYCLSSLTFLPSYLHTQMVRMSVLADCLKTISNAEKRGRRQVLIRPSSKVVVKFLQKMQEHGTSSDTIGYDCYCCWDWDCCSSKSRWEPTIAVETSRERAWNNSC